MITVDSILQKLACSQLALVKIDIEGGEQQLFDGPTNSLDHTDAIIIEFHPMLVDYSRIIKALAGCGFTFIRSNSVFLITWTPSSAVKAPRPGASTFAALLKSTVSTHRRFK